MTNVTFENIPLPKISRSSESKYAFDKLTVGGPALVIEVIDAKKGVSKLTSALVAYRARAGAAAAGKKFAVRAFKAEDGTDRVGAWLVSETQAAE